MPLMTPLRHRLHPRDMPHLGALCKRIRLARGLTGTEIARLCHCRSSATITRDFEENNQLGEGYFQRWLRIMQDGERVPMPLTREQATLLSRHYYERDVTKLLEKHRTLQGVDFALIHPANGARPPALVALVDQLARTPYPAMIMDDLWFVHVVNEGLLRLYGIDPQGPFLRRWEGWHAVASKIPAGSPVRLAHDQSGQFIPPTIVYFYQHEFVQRHLFTLQVRHLLHRLFAESAKEDYEIHKWSDQLLAFALPFSMEAGPRVVTFNGTPVVTTPAIAQVAAARVQGGRQVHYALCVWETYAPASMTQQATPQPLYFAADYDRERTFHVNRWPGVTQSLERLLG